MTPLRHGAARLSLIFGACLLCSLGCNLLQAANDSSFQIEVIDPNPTLLTPEGTVILADTVEAVDRLSSNHPGRIGVIADGISQLLLRVRASNAITFLIPARLGNLRGLNEPAEDASTVTVHPRNAGDGTQWAFALYTPPADLPHGLRRTFLISARDGIQTASVSLRLERPPVLLVHGLWSDSSAWNGLREFLRNKHYLICEDVGCAVNYGPVQPAPSFDPMAGELENQFAVNHLIEATATVLLSLRLDGIAATQVDVVAHSLGGLIARSRTALTDPARAYRRSDNFHRGDFHKLITIGTPHRGTPLASFLVANRAMRPAFFGGLTVEEYLGSIGRPFGRAIEEMQVFSPAIAHLGSTTNIPSHAIVGVAPKETETEQSLDYALGSIAFLTTVDAVLGGNGMHDTIVPRSSQAGGLAGRAVTFARRTVHTDLSGDDVGETESSIIWRRVAQLLRAPVRLKLFGNFTALETNAGADIPRSD